MKIVNFSNCGNCEYSYQEDRFKLYCSIQKEYVNKDDYCENYYSNEYKKER